MSITVVKCCEDGTYLVIDTSEIYEGGEQLASRLRIACDIPRDALVCIASALWPLRKFQITEETESDDASPRH